MNTAPQLVAAADELEVVGEVVTGLGFGHAGQGVAEHDPLVEGGERLIRPGARLREDVPTQPYWSSCLSMSTRTSSARRLTS